MRERLLMILVGVIGIVSLFYLTGAINVFQHYATQLWINVYT